MLWCANGSSVVPENNMNTGCFTYIAFFEDQGESEKKLQEIKGIGFRSHLKRFWQKYYFSGFITRELRKPKQNTYNSSWRLWHLKFEAWSRVMTEDYGEGGNDLIQTRTEKKNTDLTQSPSFFSLWHLWHYCSSQISGWSGSSWSRYLVDVVPEAREWWLPCSILSLSIHWPHSPDLMNPPPPLQAPSQLEISTPKLTSRRQEISQFSSFP